MEEMRASSLKSGSCKKEKKQICDDDDAIYQSPRWSLLLKSESLVESLDAPYVWERMTNAYRIVDLTKNRFGEALQFIKKNYFVLEPMCRVTMLAKDQLSMWTYLDIMLTRMLDMNSMCALEESTGKLVGVAVAAINLKADQIRCESRTRMHDGEAFFRLMTLKNWVFSKSHLYEKLEIDRFLRMHVLCVNPIYQNKGIGTALVGSCTTKARILNGLVVIGAFSSGSAQTIGRRLGFQTLSEVPYKGYMSPKFDEKPFEDPGLGNYSVACMASPIPPYLPPPTLPPTKPTKKGKDSKKPKKTPQAKTKTR